MCVDYAHARICDARICPYLPLVSTGAHSTLCLPVMLTLRSLLLCGANLCAQPDEPGLQPHQPGVQVTHPLPPPPLFRVLRPAPASSCGAVCPIG